MLVLFLSITVVALAIFAVRERRMTRTLRRAVDVKATEADKNAEALSLAKIDLKEVQLALKQKEQLAEVGELAAIIAHEVRNPLAIITNAVAGLRRRETSQADRDTLIAILNEESFRLNRLVRDLLGFTRPLHFRPVQVSLAEVVWRAIDSVEVPSTIDIEVEENNGHDIIWGDPNLLMQAIANLVQNAVQASGAKGQLMVVVRGAELRGDPGVHLVVRDQGEGMSPEVLQRAKNPFYTTRPSGTGLGLAIVERIVQTHRGEMELASVESEGTSVSIFFPSAPGSIRMAVSPFSPRDTSIPRA